MNEYLTDRLGREGVERHRDEPSLLYLASHAPHGPILTIDKYNERFPGIEDETAQIYAAMISALDDWVGAVLAEQPETRWRHLRGHPGQQSRRRWRCQRIRIRCR